LSEEGEEPRQDAAEPLPAVVSADLDLDAKLSYTHTADL
jgi:hypothetical protein